MGEPIKLNLGCGNRHLAGFINVDLADNWCKKKPEIVCDVRKLEIPNEFADEVHAYHVFEHFYRYEADDILDEWIRVLKPGGLLVLELPCLDKILALFDYFSRRGEPLKDNLTLWGMYGDPKYKTPAMVHHWCYSVGELTQMLEGRGLTAKECEATTHQPVRDMRIEAIKCTK